MFIATAEEQVATSQAAKKEAKTTVEPPADKRESVAVETKEGDPDLKNLQNQREELYRQRDNAIQTGAPEEQMKKIEAEIVDLDEEIRRRLEQSKRNAKNQTSATVTPIKSRSAAVAGNAGPTKQAA